MRIESHDANSSGPPEGSDNPDLATARSLVAAGDALAAVDILQNLPDEQSTLAARQLLALALLRAGALPDAHTLIAALVAEGHVDEETLGLVARESKARFRRGDRSALPEAREAYLRAYRATGGTWTGINAAMLALLDGDAADADRIAREVGALLAKVPPASRATFWHRATAGEVALLTGDTPLALAIYREAHAVAPRAFGDHRSARDNALAILSAKGLALSTLMDVFPGIGVAVFSGHTIDPPGRTLPRFPASLEANVIALIDEAIAAHAVEIGISGAACGGDILFLEALQRAGKETHIVLPHPPDEFRKVSVTDIAGEHWGARFDNVLARANAVTVLAPARGEDLAYQFQGAIMAGTALLRAHGVGGQSLGIALWDGQVGGVGGTGTVVEEWAERGLEVLLLPFGDSPGGLLSPSDARALLRGLDLRHASGQRVVSILFADALGFSKLGERQVKSFVREFWGRVATILESVPQGDLLNANTWGDGLFLVFDDSRAAADTALGLAQMVAETRWTSMDLPENTNIRIALHAGPAYEIDDPVTGRPGFAGMHISRAARIEPVTPPGEVYVSEAFAALLAFDDNQERFACEYVGTVPMAKEYGRFRTYRLARR